MARPTKYKKDMCEKARKVLEDGESQTAVMAALGISRDTFYRWKAEIKEFSDTIKEAELKGQRKLESIGLGLATGKLKGNVVAWIFIMKNRFNEWSDRPDYKDGGNELKIIIDDGDAHGN